MISAADADLLPTFMENLLRKCVLASLLVAFALAGCRGPAGQPTPTPFSPTPATVFAPPFPDKTVQIAWFYKPPTDGDLAVLAAYFDVFILTKKDEAARDTLRSQGVSSPFLQYLRFDTIHDPGSCTAEPWNNQVAYQIGDFCAITEQHPDWFLLDTKGERIASGNNYLMDAGNSGWRAFWLERARQSQEQLGWDGVFLDNVEASLFKHERLGAIPAAYPDDASYQAAIEGFLEYIYANYFQPRGRPLFANVIALRDPSVWFRYLQHLDGAMEEQFAADWSDGYLSGTEWEEQMTRAEQTQRLGKHIILVAQGAREEVEREQFAFASYLLVTAEAASFRYTDSDLYGEAWIYSNYLLDLGEPLGPRYYEGGVWRRDFANALVSVDIEKHTATIVMR